MIIYYYIMNAANSSSVGVQGENTPLPLATFNAYVFIGPVVLGGLVNACLFGCLIIQTYLYYANFVKDHRGVKLTVSEIGMRRMNH